MFGHLFEKAFIILPESDQMEMEMENWRKMHIPMYYIYLSKLETITFYVAVVTLPRACRGPENISTNCLDKYWHSRLRLILLCWVQ